MSRIAVVTDTCASVLPDLVSDLDIRVVPYYISREGQMLEDGVDIDYEEFFRYLAETSVLPTTANPGAGEYLEVFEAAIAGGAAGIAVATMTAEGSGAYQAAMVARDMLRERLPDYPVGVCDTRNVSGAHFLFSVEGGRAASRGWTLAQIMDLWKRMVPATHMIHTAPSLDYLYKGGRIGRAKHMVAALLKVKPIITMTDGIIEPIAQVRSRTMDKVCQKMISLIRDDVGDTPVKMVFIHTQAPDLADQARQIADGQLNVAEAFIAPMSPALGVHNGPGTVSISYVPVPILQ